MRSVATTIFGNTPQRSALDSLTAESGRSQVILLSGPQGVGKASHLLQSLESQGNPPEVLAPEPSAEDMREAVADVLVAPSFGPYRAVVLDGLGSASEASVSSCLKLFEDPPRGSRFFLVAEDPLVFPDPLLSRIQSVVRFFPLGGPDMLLFASTLGPPDDFSLRVSSGRPGVYKEVFSEAAYKDLWSSVRSACLGLETPAMSMVPKLVRELPSPGSAGRLAASMTCLDAAKSALSEGAGRAGVCRMLEFSSALLKLSRFDSCAHWARGIFPM